MTNIFYNSKGNSIAFLDEDGESIYLYDGTPAAYLYKDSVYGYDGTHLGWFVNGWIYDRKGDYVFFTRQALEGPVKPITLTDLFSTRKKPKPAAQERQIEPERFRRSTSWSLMNEKTFFKQSNNQSSKYGNPQLN